MTAEAFVRATEASLKSLMGLSARDSAEVTAAMLKAGSREELELAEPLDQVASLIDAEGVEEDDEYVWVTAPEGATTVYCRISERRYYIGVLPRVEKDR